MRYERLAKTMAACFPTKTPSLAHKDILAYQRDRIRGGTDWEGERALFQKIIRISLDRRRKDRLSNDIVRKAA